MECRIFDYPCVILLNTPEIRAELEKIGYTDYWKDADLEKNTILCIDSNSIIKNYNELIPRYIALSKDFVYTKWLTEQYINCGTNVELFLALAACRQDSDKYQYFIYTGADDAYTEPIFCTLDSWEDEFYSFNMNDDILPYMFRKADKDDLIKMFADNINEEWEDMNNEEINRVY